MHFILSSLTLRKPKFFARRYAPILLVLVRVREPLLINQFPSRVRLREGELGITPAGCVLRKKREPPPRRTVVKK